MRLVQRVSDLCGKRERAVWTQHPLTAQQTFEVLALHVPHRDVQLPVDLTRLVHRQDVRVIERRRQPRLPQEPFAEAVVIGKLRGEQLQRNLTV